MTTTERTDQSLTRVLQQHLARRYPEATSLRVRPRDAAPNGYSNVTQLYDATWTVDGVPDNLGLVVRSQVEGHELFYDTALDFQWRMMEAVAAHSYVPVPALLLYEDDPSTIGAPFFVMEAVEGKVPINGTPSYHAAGWVAELTTEQRRTLSANAVDALVRIHEIPWRNGFEFLDRPDRGRPGLDQYLTYQEQWHDWVAQGRSVPTIEAALRWLRDNQPADPPACVSWGDSRVGNMIFSADLSVAAVIDWEQASLGCPEMDVAWWLMFEDLFTAGTQPLDGILDRAGLIDAYERRAGRPLADLHYYDVLAWTRIAICCLRMYGPGADDPVDSIEQPFLATLRELLVAR